MRPPVPLLLLSLVLAGPASAEGLSGEPEPTVTLQLIPERAAVAPGERARVALVFDVEPGWHIYWKNPGETGLATDATLSSIDSRIRGPEYPAPRLHLDDGPITSFVYEGRTALFWHVTAEHRGPLPLSAEARWLVCRERCVYQTGVAQASVLVGRRTPPTWSPDVAALRAQVPRWSSGVEVRAAVVADGSALEVTLRAPAGSDLFPSVELEQWATASTQRPFGPDTLFTLRGPAPAGRGQALLGWPGSWAEAVLRLPDGVATVDVPLDSAAAAAVPPLPDLPPVPDPPGARP